jgi:subtilisin family serine protease
MLARRTLAAIAAIALVFALSPTVPTEAQSETRSYIVVFSATEPAEGAYELGGSLALNHGAALALVRSAGGTVSADLSSQIGVMLVRSANAAFADILRASSLVAEVGEDFGWKQFPSMQEALASGQLTIVDESAGTATAAADPLESLQWGMQMIHAPQARALQDGERAVSVGILDTGVDAAHVDFVSVEGGGSNIDCVRGRDFIPLGPLGSVGSPSPCVDNNFHGTHVSGIVAAQANGHGVVGVAPGVTLVPVKVCDAEGFCYAGPVVAGITYAGDARLDVINMSFFMDDDEHQESTELKCNDDPEQRAFRKAGERALKYARGKDVTPVAAIGNSDRDLAASDCDVVPGESPGVIGTSALGPRSQKAGYSSWGFGAVDVAAPGGAGTTGNPTQTILSTIPGNSWGSFQGTSMASPHNAGVAALIATEIGQAQSDGGWKAEPSKVQSRLQDTTIDIGLEGYDECFGHGRIDALRAVQNDRSDAYDASAPFCPEYNE